MKKKYCVAAAILLITGGVFLISRNTPEALPEEKIILTQHQLEPYLNINGWEVALISADEITIPEKFEGRYLEFSEIMFNNGFNLKSHKGETVMKYTYTVENYGEDGVIAELLVTKNNELISAALIQQKQNGFIKGL